MNDEECKEDNWTPCDDCEMNYINCCASCCFASSSINESLCYGD